MESTFWIEGIIRWSGPTAGIVKIRKGFVGKRPRTWFSLTTDGRATWERHLAALRDIAAGG